MLKLKQMTAKELKIFWKTITNEWNLLKKAVII